MPAFNIELFTSLKCLSQRVDDRRDFGFICVQVHMELEKEKKNKRINDVKLALCFVLIEYNANKLFFM